MNILLSILLLPLIGFQNPALHTVDTKQLSYHEFSLNDRYADSFVNNVFKDNILLTLDYATGGKIDPYSIDWSGIEKPFKMEIKLKPGETFAFHEDVLPQFKDKKIITTNAHFDSSQGFKSDGWLVGDGVCHLASLLYWTAKDAGLEALAPTRHDFAPVPDIPREYGTSIYYMPGQNGSNEAQNLYITNNKEKSVTFVFNYDGQKLGITAQEEL